MKQPTGWQNAPPLSPGRCLQAHRAAGTPRGGSPAPYSQEVHWAPSLQEHPRELRHPVDRERLGGALTLAEAGHTFPNRHLCFLPALCTAPRAAVPRGRAQEPQVCPCLLHSQPPLAAHVQYSCRSTAQEPGKQYLTALGLQAIKINSVNSSEKASLQAWSQPAGTTKSRGTAELTSFVHLPSLGNSLGTD